MGSSLCHERDNTLTRCKTNHMPHNSATTHNQVDVSEHRKQIFRLYGGNMGSPRQPTAKELKHCGERKTKSKLVTRSANATLSNAQLVSRKPVCAFQRVSHITNAQNVSQTSQMRQLVISPSSTNCKTFLTTKHV